jgi:hypothetical protein
MNASGRGYAVHLCARGACDTCCGQIEERLVTKFLCNSKPADSLRVMSVPFTRLFLPHCPVVCCQSTVPLTLLDLPGNVAILSRSPPDTAAGNATLATYRYAGQPCNDRSLPTLVFKQ